MSGLFGHSIKQINYVCSATHRLKRAGVGCRAKVLLSVAPRVLDHLAVILQAAKRLQLHIAAQLSDVTN